MIVGIAILIGPVTLFIGLPRCRFSIDPHGRQARRKNPIKDVKTPREATIAPTKAIARDTVSTTSAFQLDQKVREDSIAALVTLGFPKRQAQSRVDAVTAGSSAEAVIKAALRGGR